MMSNAMLNPNYRQWLAERLSCGGRFTVLFVSYPDQPEVFELVSCPKDRRPIRHVNICAQPDAKISRLIG